MMLEIGSSVTVAATYIGMSKECHALTGMTGTVVRIWPKHRLAEVQLEGREMPTIISVERLRARG